MYEDGRHPSSIKIKAVSVEEDAKRRDFTINALYYDPIGSCYCLTKPKNVKLDHDCQLLKTKDKILDFVGGQKDLKDRIIRAVGNPKDRFKEDKLRMIRAVRLRFQLNKEENTYWNPTFQIEEKTKQAIKDLANELLPTVSYERIWQEINKANKYIRFHDFFYELELLGLLYSFFPEFKEKTVIHREDMEDLDEILPRNTPTLIKIMAFLGTFDKDKVLEITQRFGLKKPNWIE